MSYFILTVYVVTMFLCRISIVGFRFSGYQCPTGTGPFPWDDTEPGIDTVLENDELTSDNKITTTPGKKELIITYSVTNPELVPEAVTVMILELNVDTTNNKPYTIDVILTPAAGGDDIKETVSTFSY